MKKYQIEMSEQADKDLENLAHIISYEYKSFNTAKKYLDGIVGTINSLRTSAESFQLQTRSYFQKYGMFVYRINYKKMAIIYTIHDDKVIVQEITPASMITGL